MGPHPHPGALDPCRLHLGKYRNIHVFTGGFVTLCKLCGSLRTMEWYKYSTVNCVTQLECEGSRCVAFIKLLSL